MAPRWNPQTCCWLLQNDAFWKCAAAKCHFIYKTFKTGILNDGLTLKKKQKTMAVRQLYFSSSLNQSSAFPSIVKILENCSDGWDGSRTFSHNLHPTKWEKCNQWLKTVDVSSFNFESQRESRMNTNMKNGIFKRCNNIVSRNWTPCKHVAFIL